MVKITEIKTVKYQCGECRNVHMIKDDAQECCAVPIHELNAYVSGAGLRIALERSGCPKHLVQHIIDKCVWEV